MWLLRVLEHSPHILFDHSTAKESSSAPPRDSAPFQIIIRYQIKGSAFYDNVRLLTPPHDYIIGHGQYPTDHGV